MEEPFEGREGVEHAGFDGANGDGEDAGDVGVGEFLADGEDEDLAVFLGKLGEGGLDVHVAVEAGEAAVGGGGDFAAVALGEEAEAGGAAEVVLPGVAGDGVEVGGEFGGGTVAGAGFPEADEGLLGQVFGAGGGTEAGEEVEEGLLVLGDEGGEGGFVVPADAPHEEEVLAGVVGLAVGGEIHWGRA